MEFKQYPSYKYSAVEWLGDIPKHWESNRLKKYLIERNEKNTPVKTDNLLSVTMYQGVIPVSEKQGNGGNKPKENLENYKISYPNDIVLNSMNVIVGSVGLNKYMGLISPAYYALYNRNKNNNIKFFSYIFHNPFFQKGLFGLGNGIMYKESEDGKLNTIRLKIPMEKLNQVVLPCPSISEQNQIVSFLDTETARIDNLIAKQEKLIELLEEQRKSIISHAVTKGLNPDAPMKDSGVEWLGDVPEHWTVLKNRHIFNFSKGLSITKENLQESGIPCVSYGEVHSKFGFEFNPEINDMKFVSEEYLKTSKNCLLNSGDFIFADTSEDFEGSGNFSYLNSNSQVFAGYHTVIARLKSKQKPRFFAYIFDSNAHRKQIQTQVKGIKVFSITQGILKDIYSWLPPVHEQDLIVEYLDNECKKISLLKAKQIELIEKLKEYRSSIISHAVTGKIDVREFGA